MHTYMDIYIPGKCYSLVPDPSEFMLTHQQNNVTGTEFINPHTYVGWILPGSI